MKERVSDFYSKFGFFSFNFGVGILLFAVERNAVNIFKCTHEVTEGEMRH